MYTITYKWHRSRGAGEEEHRSEFTLDRSFMVVGGAVFLNRGWSPEPSAARNRVVFLCVASAGALVYWHWEAMIISFLAVRTIVLPFHSLEDLLENTDTKAGFQCCT